MALCFVSMLRVWVCVFSVNSTDVWVVCSVNGQAGTTPVPLRHVQFGDSSLSLNEYAEIDPSKFLEDGSFNGAYVNRSFRMK